MSHENHVYLLCDSFIQKLCTVLLHQIMVGKDRILTDQLYINMDIAKNVLLCSYKTGFFYSQQHVIPL